MTSVSISTAPPSALSLLATAAQPQSASDAVNSALTKDVTDELDKFGMGSYASSTAITGFVSKLGQDVLGAIQSSNGADASSAVGKAVSGDLSAALASVGYGAYASSSDMTSFASQLGADAIAAAESAAPTVTSATPATSASTPATALSQAANDAIAASLTKSVDAALDGMGAGAYASSKTVTDLIAQMGKDVGAALQSSSSANAASAVGAALTKDVTGALTAAGYGAYASSPAVADFVSQAGKDAIAAASAAPTAPASQPVQAVQAVPAAAPATAPSVPTASGNPPAQGSVAPSPSSTLSSAQAALTAQITKQYGAAAGDAFTKFMSGFSSKLTSTTAAASTASRDRFYALGNQGSAEAQDPVEAIASAVEQGGTDGAAELLENGQKAYREVLAQLHGSTERDAATGAPSSTGVGFTTPSTTSTDFEVATPSVVVNDNRIPASHPVAKAYREHADAA